MSNKKNNRKKHDQRERINQVLVAMGFGIMYCSAKRILDRIQREPDQWGELLLGEDGNNIRENIRLPIIEENAIQIIPFSVAETSKKICVDFACYVHLYSHTVRLIYNQKGERFIFTNLDYDTVVGLLEQAYVQNGQEFNSVVGKLIE